MKSNIINDLESLTMWCSVAYVSRSGGMSNELNNIISRNADGVYEGVAIGGDRYPGSTFLDHLLRFQVFLFCRLITSCHQLEIYLWAVQFSSPHLFAQKDDPSCKLLVLLGEVGGIEEYYM